MLSLLPPRPPELVHLVEHLDSTPLSCALFRIWTDHDPTLSRVRKCTLRKWVQEEWPTEEQKDNQTFNPTTGGWMS